MSTVQIIAAVALAWVLLAAITGLVVSLVIRNRDQQVPKPPHVEPRIPEQRSANRKPRKRTQRWPFGKK